MPVAEKTNRQGRTFMDISSILFARNRMIFVTDTITDELAADVIQQLLYLAAVSSEDITMIINSPGGSVTAGLAIYDTMQGIPCDVSTVCIGAAASMGAFLLAAGTRGKRFATAHSEIMIHQVVGGVQGQAVDIEIAAHRIGRIKDTINGLLAAFTGQDIGRIQADTDRDHFMDPEESIRYGMIDGIVSDLLRHG